MGFLSNTLMVVGTIFLFYYLYKGYQFYKKEVAQEKELEQEAVSETIHEEPEQLYEFNTDQIKYSLYNPSFEGLHELSSLYKLVVHNNLWIDEPFHTKFYEFLMIINDNNFMIIDSLSKVITMNTRDKYNKVQTSKSYQVYSTKEIIKYAIPYCMGNIKRFNKRDAQNLLISIFVVVLKQSVHYLSREVPQNSIDKLLKGYKYAQAVKSIVELVEEADEQLYFIQESIYDAFTVLETFPYNDSEVSKAIEIRRQPPQKLLQKI